MKRRFLRGIYFFPLFYVLFFLVFASSALGNGEDLTVEIPAAVSVTDTSFTLSEIARLSGDGEAVKRTGALLLSLPEGGLLTRKAIVEAMTAAGIGGLRIRFIMPPEVSVLLSKDISALVRALARWQWTVEAEPLGPVPDGKIIAPLSIAPGTGSATLKFDDGDSVKSLAVRLSWSQPGIVAARPLERGTILAPGDIALQTVRVLRSQGLASAPEEVLGRELQKSLSAGEPVPLNILSVPPILKRGEPVLIVFRRNGFLIEVRGEALDGGAAGDLVRVRNLQSRTVIRGVITGPGRVEVQ